MFLNLDNGISYYFDVYEQAKANVQAIKQELESLDEYWRSLGTFQFAENIRTKNKIDDLKKELSKAEQKEFQAYNDWLQFKETQTIQSDIQVKQEAIKNIKLENISSTGMIIGGVLVVSLLAYFIVFK